MLPERALRWVTGVIGPGSRVVSVHRLGLGGWHVNHALRVEDRDGGAHRVVLRRWARPGWADDDADYTVERELRVLRLVAPTPVPAPAPIAADAGALHCDVPAILLTRLPGHPPRGDAADDPRFTRRLAATLAEIHGIEFGERDLDPVRLYYDRAAATPPAWLAGARVWVDAAAVRAPPPPTRATFIHRDYHHENTLWSRGRLTGVVDWTQASCGPAGLDLGHLRWNLALDYGQHVADRFLAEYRSVAGRTCPDQPYWDLVAVLDLVFDQDGPGDLDAADLARLAAHADRALAELRGPGG